MARPVHQDKTFPECEGSGVLPIDDWGWATTAPERGSVPCPMCGHTFRINLRTGRIRAHRRIPLLDSVN